MKFEDIVDAFNNKGLLLLEKEYLGGDYPMEFYCSKHDYYGIVKWNNLKQNKGGCKYCNKNKSNKHSYEHVAEIFSSRGFTLISKEYLGNKHKLDVLCPTHGVIQVTLDSFTNSIHGCKKCASEINANKQRDSTETIRKEFLNGGYILAEDAVYTNWNTNLPCYCIKHPEKLIYVRRQNARNGKGCIECKREKLKGENCHFWKGGITTGNRAFRTSFEYKQWRNTVFTRDDYTCQCCGKIGGKLNAHHINNFSSNEHLRLDVHNGITLCIECHAFKYDGSFHHIHGTYNNDIFQLQQYFDDTREWLGLSPIDIIEDIIYKDYIFDN